MIVGPHRLGILASVGGGATPQDYVDAVLADAPVAFWPLDETSGTVAVDATGNGNDGTYKGGFTLAAAKPFPAGEKTVEVTRDGYVECTTLGSAGFTALSIELWLRIIQNSSNGENYFASKDVSGENMGDASFRNHSNLEWTSQGNSFIVNASANIRDSAFHYVVMTYDGSDYRLYLDGTQIVIKSGPGHTEWDSSAPFQIGGVLDGDTTYSPAMRVGYVAIYGRALGASEQQQHYDVAMAG